MMQTDFINFFIVLVCLSSFGYLLFALFAVELLNINRKHISKTKNFQPAVTILKPLYGLDPDLAENLRSFCQQDYPEYQIIFGVKDESDPVIPIVQSIIKEFQDIDISLVVDPRLYGTNHKVSNLINMYPSAKYDYLLVADSDMRVTNDYLTQVMAHFSDDETGAVSCLYSGSSKGNIASKLNAMFINEWFLPSVLISRIIQPVKFCLGATMVVRRDLLEQIGGFRALANYLADDYMLGKLVSKLGYKIKIANVIVENVVEEPSIKGLISHELRWARTLRRVEPLGYAFTFLTDTTIIMSIATGIIYAATQNISWAISPLLLVLLGRITLHKRVKQITGMNNAGNIWLIPIRDLLSFIIRILSFTGNHIQWRDNSFNVDTVGVIHTDDNLQTELDNKGKIPDLATTQDY